MRVFLDELTPEEIELNKKRGGIKAQLMGDNKASSEDGRFHCTYCRWVMTRSQVRLSHIIPPSQGGETELRNMVLACPGCCTSKHGRNLEDWLNHLQAQASEVTRLLTYHPNPMPKEEKPAA